MLYFPFKNYGEFCATYQAENLNGEKRRKNAVGLTLMKWVFVNRAGLENTGLFRWSRVKRVSTNDSALSDLCRLLGLPSLWQNGSHMRLPNNLFVCAPAYVAHDGEVTPEGAEVFVRKSGKIQLVKWGKIILNALHSLSLPASLPASVVNHVAEKLTEQCSAAVLKDAVALRVDDDFAAAYSSEACGGVDFHSCMCDAGYWPFYRNAVTAKVAALVGADGAIKARAILWPEVHGYTDPNTGEGKTLRMLDRVYFAAERYGKILLSKVTAAGLVDIYKPIGCDCRQATNIQAVNPDTLPGLIPCLLWVNCTLNGGNAVSYQDTFKEYDPETNRASVEDDVDETEYFDLGTTSGVYHRYYDEWAREYTSEDLVAVYYQDARYMTAESNADEYFVRCYDGNLYHHQEVALCAECGWHYPQEKTRYFSGLGVHICTDCLDNA